MSIASLLNHTPSPIHGRAPTAIVTALILALAPASGAMAHGVSPAATGPAIVYGGASHPHSVQSALYNPASPAASAREGLWFGLGALAAGYELGDVDDLLERAEDLEDALDRRFTSVEEAEELRDEFDDFLREAGKNGYFKVGGSVQLPFTPIGGHWPALGGTVAVEASGVLGVGGRILDAPLTVGFDGTDFTLESEAAAYVQQAKGYRLSLGYSRAVLRNAEGTLTLGSRLNYYRLDLSRAVVRLDEADNGGDFVDRLEDELERKERSSSAVGLDMGVLWTGDHYQVGGTVRNFNEPSFDYPTLTEATNDRVARRARYTMERQLQMEAALFTADRQWFLGASYDVNTVEDAVGDDFRWAAIGGGYTSSSLWIPGVRAGYRKNLAGSELGYYTLGTTLFRVLNLDAAIATESVRVDGDRMPRSAMASLGAEIRF